MIRKLLAYRTLSRLKKQLLTDPYLREFVVLGRDSRNRPYDVTITELSYDGIVLQAFNDQQILYTIEYRNGQFLYCPTIGGMMSHDFDNNIFQNSIELLDVISDACDLGITFLRINNAGAPVLYLAIPITPADLTRKGFVKLTELIKQFLGGPVQQAVQTHLEQMSDIDAFVQEFAEPEGNQGD